MHFAELLRKAAQLHRNVEAVVFDDRRLTYHELHKRAASLAAGLVALGLEPGDRVATLGDNQFESVEEICGLELAGLVRVPMYTQNSADVHLHMLNLTGAKAVIVQGSHFHGLAPLLVDAPMVGVSIVHGADTGLQNHSVLDYDGFLGQAPTVEPVVDRSADETYMIRFSAGSTGRPKGIAHSYRGWAAMGNELALMLPRISVGDAQLVAGPLSHMACLLVWPMIAHGATQVVMPKFDAGEALRLIEVERCGYAVLVPTMIQMMVNHPKAEHFDLTSLKAVLYGASPIAERTLLDARALWGNVMHQMYGQSESVPATMLTPEFHVVEGTEAQRRRLRSAGRPTPNAFVKIVDEDGADCPTGEVGEIVIDAPGNMLGLWQDPEGTALRILDGRWVRTRDIGYLDEDGFLFIADRKEDMIISGGFNIWPAEVENALCSHPAVLEAVAIGVPDEKWGETVLAVVVLRDGPQTSEHELIDWCRDRIGSVKKPTAIVFSEAPLPKSGTGKAMRRVIRSEYWAAGEPHVAGS